METALLLKIAIFAILLTLSAFFSGSETAFFSLSRLTLQKLKDDKRKGAGRLQTLLSNPQRLLTTILFGNTLVNVLIASMAAIITIDLCETFGFNEFIGLAIEIIAVTVVILLFGEIMPKVLAMKHAETLSLKAARSIQIFQLIFFPVTLVLTMLTRRVTHLLGLQGRPPFVTEDEIKVMISEGGNRGSIEEDEQAMLQSLFTFSSTSVKEIMVPRIDMKCIDDTDTVDDALKLIREAGFSRIPIFHENIDHIEKVLYAKDLLKHNLTGNKNAPIIDIARDAYVVPSSKKIDDLLKELRREKVHIAIVVDEYGGTAGMVTLEDILEEIVGEIQDEYDEEEPLYKWTAPKTMLVNAKIDLTDLSEALNITFPEDEDYETLAGLIFDLTERVPEEHEEISYKNLLFTVICIEQHRIVEVKIDVGNPAHTSSGKQDECPPSSI